MDTWKETRSSPLNLDQMWVSHEQRPADFRPARRQLGILTLLALSFNICNSWGSIAGSLQLALLEGGTPALVYGIIGATVIFLCIGVSLAEMASVWPSAGGQYHYVSLLAPKGWRRGLSYTAGLVTIFSWVAIVASIAMIGAQYIAALASLHHPDYTAQRWQVFLIYEGLVLIALVAVLFFLKKFPILHLIGVVQTLSLYLINVICYLGRSSKKTPNEQVWSDYVNHTGWSNGVSFLIGLSTVCFIFCGLDAATHMAEEVTEPTRKVPQTIMMTIAMGFAAAFSYTLALTYALPDIQDILNGEAFIPLQVQAVGFRSESMASGISIAMVVMILGILSAAMETASRLTWSFARDEGLAFSNTLMTVHPVLEVPIYAILLSGACVALFGALYAAAETAFNALVGLTVTFQQVSYMIPIGLLIYHGRSSRFLPPRRYFRLPTGLGWAANILALVFTITIAIFANFPPDANPTANSMNYSSAILAFAFLLGAVNWWVYAKKHFNGPTIDFAAVNEST